MFQDDPNEAVMPDYVSDKHWEVCQQLVAEGLTDNQATRSLASLWTITNNAAKECWAAKQQRLEKIHRQNEEEEEHHLQLLHDKEEATRLEERKKEKQEQIHTHQAWKAYAIRKLKVGDFCKLHYFTNKGLKDTKTAVLVAKPEALVMLPEANRVHTWVPAAAIKDPKAAAIIKDKHLSWEEFNEAAPRMITMMRVQDWPDNHIDMHIQFWSTLQNHHWLHSPDQLKQHTLLLYWSQQHHRWYLTVRTLQGWSLKELNQDLLIEAREEIFDKHLEKQTARAIQVSCTAMSILKPL
ncbi:uncharacterized protein EDB91DRAFT_1256058 [Suillus paluster]|uniref:uncharacterized protein n=1 Tax=Suillus paluster TaxID=48578 RepID=UPI001B88046F|nr:uncharacterized protein EDB91DRAFT_1256058 [Suillus paluster]KAG1722437.1 hypothetical protein EDB91DRAFT_1256058 [Suillus paluster]